MTISERLLYLIYRGTWSPLKRYQDAVFICVILTGFTGYGLFHPAILTSRSIFALVPQDARWFAGSLCIFLVIYAFFDNKWGAVANVVVGPVLRLIDSAHQHAPVGYVVYGLVGVLAALRVLEKFIHAHKSGDAAMREVIAQAQRISTDMTTEHVRHEKSMAAQTVAQQEIANTQTEERRVDTAAREGGEQGVGAEQERAKIAEHAQEITIHAEEITEIANHADAIASHAQLIEEMERPKGGVGGAS